uniref:TPX2 domain-containing protein n=1 Tax=Mesocestoides corti TaxID=53468 RepID=A0A5K3ENC0_MESCO
MEPFYLAGAADRHARVTSRRAYLDFPVRRSMSVDTPTRTSTHHHDNHSLGGDSYSDEDDERYLSPLPCQEGCRALYSKLMSPMISSVAIDRSVSLTREGEGASNQAEADEDHLKTGNHSLPGTDAVKKAQVDPKQAAYAARKSVRGELVTDSQARFHNHELKTFFFLVFFALWRWDCSRISLSQRQLVHGVNFYCSGFNLLFFWWRRM